MSGRQRLHLAAAVAAFSPVAGADILEVPAGFPTIQEAINAAVDGDEVVVADGTYGGPGNRDLEFLGKLITVRSAGGPAACIIEFVPCPWDLDGSGAVGVADFVAVLAAWGTSPKGSPDFDGDGVVGILDFLKLLEHWGQCP